jgi:hypothetical protein
MDISILGDFADPFSSPNDPLFFTLHSAIDREYYFYQYTYLKKAEKEGPVDIFMGIEDRPDPHSQSRIAADDLDGPIGTVWPVGNPHGPIMKRGWVGLFDDKDDYLTLREMWVDNLPYVPDNIWNTGIDLDRVKASGFMYEIPDYIEEYLAKRGIE